MFFRRMFWMALVCAVSFACHTSTQAQLFFAENFEYADGDIDVVSGGLWTTHSGAGDPSVQIVDQNAVVLSPASADHNRLTGEVAGLDDVWFYAVRFSAEIGDATGVNNDYFVHFMNETTFGFNARLALSPPADANSDFSLQIWASSFGDGVTDWDGDFSFDEEIICVSSWNNGTGVATLWVNPVDANSTNVMDDELEDAMRAVQSVSLRQDGGDGAGGGSVVTIGALAAGTSFDDVLAAVQTGGVLVGDVNCDGIIDLLDVGPFVDLITDGVFDPKGDINNDGGVDLLDVGPFVMLLGG